jgi:ribosomal protein L7Ae-like RNA K-turn-binding protein
MDKLVGLLHLCRKAGKLKIGQKAVLSAQSLEHLPLILISADAGSALKRKCMTFDTITMDWNSDKMGGIFDRDKVSILGIADAGFAAEIKKILSSGELLAI